MLDTQPYISPLQSLPGRQQGGAPQTIMALFTTSVIFHALQKQLCSPAQVYQQMPWDFTPAVMEDINTS